VLYGGAPVKVEHRDGKAFVPEPRQGQRVSFRLIRDGSKVRYGAVLKVNGANTIGKERLPDLRCTRWVLNPGAGPVEIKGFQVDDDGAKAFRVLSRQESGARALDYGPDVGTITLTVFRERKGEDRFDPLEKAQQKQARIVAQGDLPSKDTLDALKADLLKEGNEDRTRGLLGEGEKVASKVRKVSFRPEPTPVMSVTIVYYRP
jgi:hypothetical protein